MTTGLGQEMSEREGVPHASVLWGFRLLSLKVRGAVGVGGTVWAAEVARARGLASLPAAAKWAFGPGLAQLSAPRKQPRVVRTGLYFSLWPFCFLYSPCCLVCSRKFFQTILAAPVDANNGGNLPPPCFCFSTASVTRQVVCELTTYSGPPAFAVWMSWAGVRYLISPCFM